MVYNGSSLKFYRNGFLMNEVPASGTLILNDWSTTIDENENASSPYANPEHMNGYINEVRIWNVARSQADIRNSMTTSLTFAQYPTGAFRLIIFLTT